MNRLPSRRAFISAAFGLIPFAFATKAFADDGTGVHISGRWAGTWSDTGTGHNGPLHAHITGDGCRYHAVFHGRFRKVIPFIYAVDFSVVGQEGDCVLLAGEHRSALTGRVYHFTARASACTFTAEFCSDKYRGHFDLTRTK